MVALEVVIESNVVVAFSLVTVLLLSTDVGVDCSRCCCCCCWVTMSGRGWLIVRTSGNVVLIGVLPLD